MLGVVQQVVDDGEVFEIARDYAQNIITGAPVEGRLAAELSPARFDCALCLCVAACNMHSCPSQTRLRSGHIPLIRPTHPQLPQALPASMAARWAWWQTSLRCWPAASTSTLLSRCAWAGWFVAALCDLVCDREAVPRVHLAALLHMLPLLTCLP